MSISTKSRTEARQARHARIRKKVHGTAERPRMSIMVSNKHMYVQFVDDTKGVTLASVSTHGMDGGQVGLVDGSVQGASSKKALWDLLVLGDDNGSLHFLFPRPPKVAQ